MRGLYAILDVEACGGRGPIAVAEAILRGGCARLQLRTKSMCDRSFLALAQELRPRCKEAGIPFVVNDRPDMARLVDADGVHLGQDDLPISAARLIVGPHLEVGVSTHSEVEASAAIAAGADLIGFGPVFDTRTKKNPDPTVGLAALERVCRAHRTPVVAIGGIDLGRAKQVAEAGATFGAAIAAICGSDDPERAARQLHEQLGGGS